MGELDGDLVFECVVDECQDCGFFVVVVQYVGCVGIFGFV